jgi:hypothetical protein
LSLGAGGNSTAANDIAESQQVLPRAAVVQGAAAAVDKITGDVGVNVGAVGVGGPGGADLALEGIGVAGGALLKGHRGNGLRGSERGGGDGEEKSQQTSRLH